MQGLYAGTAMDNTEGAGRGPGWFVMPKSKNMEGVVATVKLRALGVMLFRVSRKKSMSRGTCEAKAGQGVSQGRDRHGRWSVAGQVQCPGWVHLGCVDTH